MPTQLRLEVDPGPGTRSGDPQDPAERSGGGSWRGRGVGVGVAVAVGVGVEALLTVSGSQLPIEPA